MLSKLRQVSRLAPAVRSTLRCASTEARASPAEERPDFQIGYELSEEQKELQQVARKFTRAVVVPQAAEYDKLNKFCDELYKQAWDLGLVSPLVPTFAGGLGISLHDAVLIGEEVGYGDCGLSIVMNATNLGQMPVLLAGSKELQKKYLGRMVEQPLYASFAGTESDAGSDVANMKSKAIKQGDEYILNGSKMFISNAGYANYFTVVAKTDVDPKAKLGRAFSMFVVEAGWPGVSVGQKLMNMGLKSGDTREITFEDVRIPKENIVGAEGHGFSLTMGTFDRTRPLSSSGALGIAWRSLDEAAKYSIERKTFGKPICEHQAVGHMLAEMEIRLWYARTAVRQAAWMHDNGMPNTKMASIGKFLSAEAAMKNSLDAVQIFGGYGYNVEYPVEKLMRDAKIHSIFEGTTQIQKTIIARDVITRTQMGTL